MRQKYRPGSSRFIIPLPRSRNNLRHDQIRGRSGRIEAKRAHARITTRYLCVMTFSVRTETITSGNKRFTSKLSTLSGPKDSLSWSMSYVRSGVRLFADSRKDIVRLSNVDRAGQFERVSVGPNGRNLI